uniref:Uncharacterized protein n=1 Tax=Romanomermis culicivorax TaxID=13658 RepID=A0A915J115_ROMCU
MNFSTHLAQLRLEIHEKEPSFWEEETWRKIYRAENAQHDTNYVQRLHEYAALRTKDKKVEKKLPLGNPDYHRLECSIPSVDNIFACVMHSRCCHWKV